ncbi:sigma-70 family RNA polymerase sigma factor [Microvirga massiliensis]|uniref:sigma-70 family RNA polymerase sigma factor n=1 Tax=Microvirga massiliensis TaxID=1033741 RepID=UPI00062B62FC|nr:sigma-70 family RNA polymerase sigma factor [Microvirga massiliensis]
MTAGPDLRGGILEALPHLRVFAISLTGDLDRADDLVQEAIVKALGHLGQFTPGTNLRAWLFTILRNEFYTLHRKRRREVQDPDGLLAARLAAAPVQDRHLDLEDLKAALLWLPVEQREAVLLVAGGISYEETAQICGAAVGTIKSRVNRGRKSLAELLGIVDPEDIGADCVMKASLPRE